MSTITGYTHHDNPRPSSFDEIEKLLNLCNLGNILVCVCVCVCMRVSAHSGIYLPPPLPPTLSSSGNRGTMSVGAYRCMSFNMEEKKDTGLLMAERAEAPRLGCVIATVRRKRNPPAPHCRRSHQPVQYSTCYHCASFSGCLLPEMATEKLQLGYVTCFLANITTI